MVNGIKVKTYSGGVMVNNGDGSATKPWANAEEGRFGCPKNAEEADKLCAN